MLEFTSPNPNPGLVWGSGHTKETDPSLHGWSCRPAWPGGPLLVGRKDHPGCAALVPVMGNGWEVSVFWETPEEVTAARCAGLDPVVRRTADVPGFGLVVLGMIREITDTSTTRAAADRRVPVTAVGAGGHVFSSTEVCDHLCKARVSLEALVKAGAVPQELLTRLETVHRDVVAHEMGGEYVAAVAKLGGRP